MNAPSKRNEVAVIRHELDSMANQFQAALPAHIPVERFGRVVMTAIQNNPDLLECNRKSLFNAAVKAAQDGLLPDGREGAMVPYKQEVTWMPMIGGLRKKVRNSGEMATWDVHAVYEEDVFEYELGDEPFIRHKPSLDDDRGNLIAVYSIATLKSGEKSRDVMSRSDVDKIRKLSRAQNGPWNNPTFYPEMAKKTVARRHSKQLPMSSDLDDLIRRDDHLYDLEGARADAAADRPKSLAGRLDQLADFSGSNETVDQETGEITNQPKNNGSDREPSPPRSGNGQGKQTAEPEGKPSSDAQHQPPSDDGDPEQTARRRGAEAREKGMNRKALPAEYRKDERLTQAYLDGFDTGEAQDREPGEEG